MAREQIISADSHVLIKDEVVLEHLESRYHSDYQNARLAFMTKMAGRMKKKPGAESLMPSQEQPWEAAGRSGEYDPAERLKDMDTDQVDAEVLYTDVMVGSAYYDLGARCATLACFQAYNDAAIEFASRDPKRLLPVYHRAGRRHRRVGEGGHASRRGRCARAPVAALSRSTWGVPHYSDERSTTRSGRASRRLGIPMLAARLRQPGAARHP